jgi:hypothetical protein
VQVDPSKPTLKAPETKRLKLQCDGPLSDFAFNFNLRRYKMEEMRRGRVSINGEIFGSLRDTDFAVGSLGGMGDMNDALPLVGSMELGSPLDNFGDMVGPTPFLFCNVHRAPRRFTW